MFIRRFSALVALILPSVLFSAIEIHNYDRLFDALGLCRPTTVEALVAASQKWLRPAGLERFQVTDGYAAQKEKLLPIVRDLGVIDEVMPLHDHYRYAVVFGGRYRGILNRLAWLKHVWECGVRFDSLVLLTGNRALFSDELDALKADCPDLDKLPANETELFKIVFNRAPFSAELRHLPLIIVDTPANAAGRPTTQMTVAYWLNQFNPEPGRVLGISNQPYIRYQKAVLQSILPNSFEVEVTGSASRNPSVADVLDTIARFLYVASAHAQ